MKSTKIIFPVLLGLSTTNKITAQQPLFAPLGAVWYYDQINCPGLPNEGFSITVYEDTIINGKTCTILPNSYCPSDASCNPFVYVHQEGSKVLVYETQFSEFQMLYDFSLQTGDSYKYILCKEEWDIDTVTIHVDFADDAPTGTQLLKVVPNQPVWWGEMNVEIIKGVGGIGTNRLLFYELGCQNITLDCPYYIFRCYQTPNSGNYPAGCVSVEEEVVSQQDEILIYPNPVNDFLNFELKTSNQLTKARFRVIDATGKMMKELQSDSPRDMFIVPVREWAAGVYWLQYLEGGEVRVSEQFVVNK